MWLTEGSRWFWGRGRESWVRVRGSHQALCPWVSLGCEGHADCNYCITQDHKLSWVLGPAATQACLSIKSKIGHCWYTPLVLCFSLLLTLHLAQIFPGQHFHDYCLSVSSSPRDTLWLGQHCCLPWPLALISSNPAYALWLWP